MTSSYQICMKIARIKCFWVILSFFVSGMKLYWGMIYTAVCQHLYEYSNTYVKREIKKMEQADEK